MNIAVCISQVLDTESSLKADDSGANLDEKGLVYILDQTDEAAVEEAVRIRERLGQGEITCIAAGPSRCVEALRRCLAMGASKAVLIKDNGAGWWNRPTDARKLARAIGSCGCDLILCGDHALDELSGVVSAGVAEILGHPMITSAVRIEVSEDQKTVTIHRKLEGGVREIVRCTLPAVVTVDVGANKPRYPGVKATLRSRSTQIEEIEEQDQGTEPEKYLVKLAFPRPRTKKTFSVDAALPADQRMKLLLTGGVAQRGGNSLSGDPANLARKFVDYLVDEKIISF